MTSRVLIVRTDAIGDAIMWSGAIGRVRARFPGARLGVMCRADVAPLYRACDLVDDVLPVDMTAVRESDEARDRAAAEATAWGPGVVLQPTRSREGNTESVVSRIRAGRKISIETDTANAKADEAEAYDALYDELAPAAVGGGSEFDHHLALLRHLGDTSPEPVRPRVWLGAGDAAAARRVCDAESIDPARAMLCFPGARWRYKGYPRWAESIAMALDLSIGRAEIDAVVLCGGPKDAEDAALVIEELSDAGVRTVDLTGRTGLMATIALIGMARVSVGNDTFATHAACALGTPSAVVVGGGHIGRFVPYDGLTSCATVPLGCFGCDWWCVHRRVHCVKDVPVRVSAAAIGRALDAAPARGAGGAPARPAVFVPDRGVVDPAIVAPGALPGWLLDRVDLHRVEVGGGAGADGPGGGDVRLTAEGLRLADEVERGVLRRTSKLHRL